MIKVEITDKYVDKAPELMSEILAGLALYCQSDTMAFRVSVSHMCKQLTFSIYEETYEDRKHRFSPVEEYENAFCLHFLKTATEEEKVDVYRNISGDRGKPTYEPFRFE